MKKILLLIGFTLFLNSAFAQEKTLEIAVIKKTITQMFDAMRKGDSTLLRTSFAPGMILQTIVNKDNKTEVRSQSPEGFLKAVGTPHDKVWDEQITFDAIQVDANLASVWTSYKFYLGKDFSHCGVNSFQLVKTNGDWKITYLIDTRRKENCN